MTESLRIGLVVWLCISPFDQINQSEVRTVIVEVYALGSQVEMMRNARNEIERYSLSNTGLEIRLLDKSCGEGQAKYDKLLTYFHVSPTDGLSIYVFDKLVEVGDNPANLSPAIKNATTFEIFIKPSCWACSKVEESIQTVKDNYPGLSIETVDISKVNNRSYFDFIARKCGKNPATLELPQLYFAEKMVSIKTGELKALFQDSVTINRWSKNDSADEKAPRRRN